MCIRDRILIIYYELYVVIQIIVIRKKDSAYPLKNIILKSFQNLRSIHKPTILLTGIYIVLLLPLVHIGYLNSYVPRWDIPPFIFGELKLTMKMCIRDRKNGLIKTLD